MSEEQKESGSKSVDELAKQCVILGIPSHIPVEEVYFKAGHKSRDSEVSELNARIKELETSLKEFDTDENWLIESSYKDRPSKTGGADWVYIGKWDPRVFATHAMTGTPLPNTKEDERRTPSKFYEPGTPASWAAKEKILSLESVIKEQDLKFSRYEKSYLEKAAKIQSLDSALKIAVKAMKLSIEESAVRAHNWEEILPKALAKISEITRGDANEQQTERGNEV